MQLESEKKGFKMEFLTMDATQMSFADESFDVVFDKGTLDALAGAEDNQLTDRLLREMARVTKRDGQVQVVTYGSPAEREELFATLGFEAYEYRFARKNLSAMSQLVNIMRANSKGAALANIVKTPGMLIKSLQEFRELSEILKKEKVEPLLIDWKSDLHQYSHKWSVEDQLNQNWRRQKFCNVFQITKKQQAPLSE